MTKKKDDILEHPDLEVKREQLKGFEEVVDLLPQSRFQPPASHSKLNDNFAFLNLLEHELVRLTKLNSFLDEKLKTKKEFNQMETLVAKQKKSNLQKKEKIIAESFKRDSDFNQNMTKLFNQSFNSVKKRH